MRGDGNDRLADCCGAERMAVNIANALAEAGIESHLCATRIGGPLEGLFLLT